MSDVRLIKVTIFTCQILIKHRYTGNVGQSNTTDFGDKIVVFGYPCGDSTGNCAPYSVELSAGRYLFEAWGSSAELNNPWNSIAGLGGYASGILKLESKLKFYLYIGSAGIFNAYNVSEQPTMFAYPGAATDVRLNVSSGYEWDNPISLRSRILVAGGGGGSEWKGSTGGNGGGIFGGNGTTNCGWSEQQCPEYITTGGTQISGGIASKINHFGNEYYAGLDGLFGVSNVSPGRDMGGIGGSGYWSGASLEYGGGSGGGSSFISGHPGCIALENDRSNNPSQTNSSIHYSRIFFTNTTTIPGNSTMPLYYSPSAKGIGNSSRGALRITILIP